MRTLSESIVAIGFSFIGFVILTSLLVRLKLGKYVSEFEYIEAEKMITVEKFVNNVLSQEGIDVKLRKTEDMQSWEYIPRSSVLKVPELKDGSLVTLGVSAHELGHAVQVGEGSFWAYVTIFVEKLGVFLSYLFPFMAIIGFIFYSPFLIVSVVMYVLIVLILLIKIPVEVDATRKGLSYLKSYGELTEDELAQLKKLLWSAILTRLTDLTVGFFVLLDTNRER